MLLIRNEQMQAFRKTLRQRFEDRLLHHLLRRHPEYCAAKGVEAVKASITQGIDSAFAYGLGSEENISDYVEIMIRIGDDFDTRWPWASKVLSETALKPAVKMANLRSRAEHHLKTNAEEP
jgi:hypothetical protein